MLGGTVSLLIDGVLAPPWVGSCPASDNRILLFLQGKGDEANDALSVSKSSFESNRPERDSKKAMILIIRTGLPFEKKLGVY